MTAITARSATTSEAPKTNPYKQPVDQVLAGLGTDARVGLSLTEARKRFERYGRNELATEKPMSAWRKFLGQFQDVLVILLLIATSISAGLWLYERPTALPYEAIAILAIVLLNAMMGYVQQARAEEALLALRQMSAAQANVIRGGEQQTIPAAELVPGDIVLIRTGWGRFFGVDNAHYVAGEPGIDVPAARWQSRRRSGERRSLLCARSDRRKSGCSIPCLCGRRKHRLSDSKVSSSAPSRCPSAGRRRRRNRPPSACCV